MGDWIEEVVVAGVEARVHHGSSDTKHSGTAVLELDVELTVTLISVFDLGGERVSSGDGSGGSVVTTGEVLGSSGVLSGGHGNSFGQEAEKGDLGKSQGRDVAKSGETHTVLEDISEGVVSGKVQGSGEGHTKLLDSHTDEGNHGDTSVLDLDGSATGEAIDVIDEAEGVEKVERAGVDTKSIGGAGISVQGGLRNLLSERMDLSDER